MSHPNKIRGYNNEIYIRDQHIKDGIPCERVPLSGAMGGKYSGDLNIPSVANPTFIIECKSRKNGTGFRVIENWLKDKAILFLKRNYQPPLVVMEFDTYVKLMKSYLNGQA